MERELSMGYLLTEVWGTVGRSSAWGGGGASLTQELGKETWAQRAVATSRNDTHSPHRAGRG